LKSVTAFKKLKTRKKIDSKLNFRTQGRVEGYE
jgi:hypothetical protein